jgi:anti-sigma B factor antagonist
MVLDAVPLTDTFAVVRAHQDDVVTLAVRGVVDEVTTPSLATYLDEAMTHRPRLLIVDLTAVHFMSTSGMNLLVEMQRLTAPTPTTLRVAADGPATSRPLRLLSIDRVLDVHASVAEAMAADGLFEAGEPLRAG